MEEVFGGAVGLIFEEGLVTDEVADPGIEGFNFGFLLRLVRLVFSLQRSQRSLFVFNIFSSFHQFFLELADLLLEVKLLAIHHLHYPCYLLATLLLLMSQSIN